MTGFAATQPANTLPVDTTILRLTDVHTYYGNIHALKGLSIDVKRGEIVTLIGANGAGKTTTLKTISGLLHPREGTVEFEGRDISKTPAHELVQGRDRARPGRSPDLLAPDRPREPPDGRLHPSEHRARPRTSNASSTFFPRLARADGPAGRDAVGRRAADARDRPRAHVATAGAAARRAVARSRPDPRPADLRDHPRDQGAGHDDPARRAERAPGAVDRRPRLRPPDRPGRPVRARPPTCARTRRSARRISGRSDRGAVPRRCTFDGARATSLFPSEWPATQERHRAAGLVLSVMLITVSTAILKPWDFGAEQAVATPRPASAATPRPTRPPPTAVDRLARRVPAAVRLADRRDRELAGSDGPLLEGDRTCRGDRTGRSVDSGRHRGRRLGAGPRMVLAGRWTRATPDGRQGDGLRRRCLWRRAADHGQAARPSGCVERRGDVGATRIRRAGCRRVRDMAGRALRDPRGNTRWKLRAVARGRRPPARTRTVAAVTRREPGAVTSP